MIDYIRGEVVELTPTGVVLETYGVGYAINISLQTYTYVGGLDKKNVKLYVAEIIREDAHELYGFAVPMERSVFMLLMSVSGVGASTARMVMSAFSVAELRNVIVTENAKVMCQVKGLGPKTAQRIIIDLKDKMLKLDIEGGEVGTQSMTPVDSQNKNEAVNALTVLGFSPMASSKVLDKILRESPEASVELLIKTALKML